MDLIGLTGLSRTHCCSCPLRILKVGFQGVQLHTLLPPMQKCHFFLYLYLFVLASVLQIPPSDCLFFVLYADDSKGSPEPVTHLQWDDPYYDIARHHIVEVAGRNLSLFSFDAFAAGLMKGFSNGALGTSAVCQAQGAMTGGTEGAPDFLNICDMCNFPLTSTKLGLLLGSC